MIDIKLQNGEIQTDSAGRYAVIADRDALFQRAALNMTIAKGSFVYNRALGAEPCLDSNPDKRELVLGENDELPDLSGETVSGKLELAPGSCAFIVL